MKEQKLISNTESDRFVKEVNDHLKSPFRTSWKVVPGTHVAVPQLTGSPSYFAIVVEREQQ